MRNSCVGRIIIMLCLVLSARLHAEELTWKGGDSGDIASPSNWETSGGKEKAPQPGDVLVIDVATTTSGLTGTLDVGAAGVVIENSKKTYFGCKLTGAGSVTYRGGGERVFQGDSASSDYYGGTIFEAGLVTKFTVSNPFGSGAITLRQAGETTPRLQHGKQNLILTNDLIIVGKDGYSGPVYAPLSDAGLAGTLGGNISADCDFSIESSDRGLTIGGSVSAPGKTVVLMHNLTTTAAAKKQLTCNGAIDASVVIMASGDDASHDHRVCLSAVNAGVDNSLTVLSGTNVFAAAASWAGTNVTVKGAGSLELTAAGNLSPQTVLSVAEGGRVCLNGQFILRVRGLVINGVSYPGGLYDASNLPGALVGSGSILVADKGVCRWKGAKNASWNVAGNWEPNGVPSAGSTVLFDSTATVGSKESPDVVSVGASGLTVIVGPGCTVTSYVGFEGTGFLSLTLQGYWKQYVAFRQQGGLSLVGNNALFVNALEDPLGIGLVTMTASVLGEPVILSTLINATFGNDFNLVGCFTNEHSVENGTYLTHGALALSKTATFNGTITGTDDFTIGNVNQGGVFKMTGSMVVPEDNAIHLYSATGATAAWGVEVSGSVSGNLLVEGNWESRLMATARCAARNAVVKGTAVLVFNDNLNVPESISVEIDADAKLSVPAGVSPRITSLSVAGNPIANGTYSKTSSWLLGEGRIKVGPPGGFILYFR